MHCSTDANPNAELQSTEQKERTSKFGRAFDATFNWLEKATRQHSGKSVKRPLMAVVLVVMSGVVAYGLFSFIPQEFAPPEDRGTFYIRVNSAEGASFESSSRHMDEIEQILLPYIDEGKIRSFNCSCARVGR